MKKIQIKCTGTELINIKELKDFQGNLKRRSENHLKQICTSIEKYGFSFPFFVWKAGKSNYVLDGHGRLAALRKMIEDGYEIPDLPITYVVAKDKKEAKQKLLRLNSQYGEFDIDGLNDFIDGIDIDFDEISIGIDFEDNKNDNVKTVENLKPYDKIHVLLTMKSSMFFKVYDIIEELKQMEGVEYEQSAN